MRKSPVARNLVLTFSNNQDRLAAFKGISNTTSL
jgi:hypothetical protein